jgi:hypothetical protein
MVNISRIVLHLPAGTALQAVLSARAVGEQLGRLERQGLLLGDLKPRFALSIPQGAGQPLATALAAGVAAQLTRRGVR